MLPFHFNSRYFSFFLLLFISFTSTLFSQDLPDDRLLEMGFEHSTIQMSDGLSIEYIATAFDESQKGTIFYSTGSLATPLFIQVDSLLYGTVPFSFRAFQEDYQFVILSKPGVSIIESKEYLNNQHVAVDASGNFRKAYLERNHLDYYVEATNILIQHFAAKAKSKGRQYVVMGHSQGARVAAKVAISNSNITHLVYLSGNPLGRFDQMIREKREANLLGQISDEQAQQEIEALYERWAAINADKESLDGKNGDSNKTWVSFSEYTVDDLLSLDIPIRVAYGTRDIVSRYCDLLPIHFIQNGKTNLSLKAYPGYDHSFFKLQSDGRINYDDFIFEQVIQECIEWLKKEK
jgi:pimeloyl-ACP methyl ester carboxylesterase